MELEWEFKDDQWHFMAPEIVYTATVTSSNIISRDSQIIAFKGAHKKSKNNRDVRGLSFEDTTVHYIPRNLTTFFPNLVHLQIDNCGLKELLRKDMAGLENLEVLWISNNEIKTLPVDLFQNMTNLKEVIFSYNEIERFDVKILESLKSSIERFSILDNPGICEIFIKNPDTIEKFIRRLKRLENNRMNLERYENMFTTSKHSDFIIEVQEKKYKVHKCILASMSPVFDKMFTADPGLTSKRYENIRNFSVDAIKEFLSCLYTRDEPSRENVSVLLELAIDFDVPVLKLQCEEVLMESITPENAQQLYNLAVRHSLEELKKRAFEEIQERHPELCDYLYDKPELVNSIIESKEEHQAKKIKLEKKD